MAENVALAGLRSMVRQQSAWVARPTYVGLMAPRARERGNPPTFCLGAVMKSTQLVPYVTRAGRVGEPVESLGLARRRSAAASFAEVGSSLQRRWALDRDGLGPPRTRHATPTIRHGPGVVLVPCTTKPSEGQGQAVAHGVEGPAELGRRLWTALRTHRWDAVRSMLHPDAEIESSLAPGQTLGADQAFRLWRAALREGR
jgi:hypothetical protein